MLGVPRIRLRHTTGEGIASIGTLVKAPREFIQIQWHEDTIRTLNTTGGKELLQARRSCFDVRHLFWGQGPGVSKRDP